jgi:hypothetical protein
MYENDIDKGLLYNNPHKLVEKYQHIIKSIVRRFVAIGIFSYSEHSDAVQYINEKLLTDKIFRMQQNYDSSYYVVTYLSKIIQNICVDLSRVKLRNSIIDVSTESAEEAPGSDESVIVDQLTIQEELYRFETILRLFPRNRAKIELFLKIYCRIPISAGDIMKAYPAIDHSDRLQFLSKLGDGSRYQEMKDGEIYNNLTSIINQIEEKRNTTDALRKWVDLKINEIINVMNSEPHNSTYDRETLKYLIQRYYE